MSKLLIKKYNYIGYLEDSKNFKNVKNCVE